MAKTYVGGDRIKKIYVGDQKIKKAYVGGDLVFSAESILFQNGKTDDSGTWTACQNGYTATPTIGTKITFPKTDCITSYGRLAMTGKKVSFSGEHNISFDISKISFGLHTTNVAPDHYWTARLYVIFLPNKVTSLDFDTETWIKDYNREIIFNNVWGPTITQSESRSSRSESIDFTLEGDYYVGFINCGYNCNTTEFTINNVVIE